MPDWIVKFLPASIAENFEHISDVDLIFNDLTICDPADVRDLHQCKWVHTLHVDNETMTRDMFDAIAGFPNLQTLHVGWGYDALSEHEVQLADASIPGVRIVIKE